MKDGEGFKQTIFMHNPWTWTMIWELACGGMKVGLGGGGEREKSEKL